MHTKPTSKVWNYCTESLPGENRRNERPNRKVWNWKKKKKLRWKGIYSELYSRQNKLPTKSSNHWEISIRAETDLDKEKKLNYRKSRKKREIVQTMTRDNVDLKTEIMQTTKEKQFQNVVLREEKT